MQAVEGIDIADPVPTRDGQGWNRIGTEVEPAIESVRECAEVSCRALVEIESMVAAAETGLEIAEHGVHPLELRHVLRLSASNGDRFVIAPGRSDCESAGRWFEPSRRSQIKQGVASLQPFVYFPPIS